jgi:hypothetical protein
MDAVYATQVAHFVQPAFLLPVLAIWRVGKSHRRRVRRGLIPRIAFLHAPGARKAPCQTSTRGGTVGRNRRGISAGSRRGHGTTVQGETR